MSAAEALCLIRGYHKPTAEIAPEFPKFYFTRGWAEHSCNCGWKAYLPYIATAAGVLFTCEKCGDKEFTWRAQ